ncbi:hypothetical protein [Flavobacterium cerinum]|uniref:Lipoprotein n=1 Tax=Flavobacterium cerinum TaxID=2502784 RepID=A0ABY5IR06_9FLAO|nr:hypothetical protein [Flavobacterium cerinum]UUC44711.1 hypothetical protein NOX80_13855 [Flavobacterium cerinum]
MKNNKKRFIATSTLLILFLGMLFSGCKKKDFNEYRSFYRAVHQNDTALLSIETHEDRFYGHYQIYYGSRAVKDSGSIEGVINGDTLRAKYRYRSFGGGINVVPVIFLKRNDKLILGSGIAASYMNFVYYKPEFPIDFDNSKFIFDPVKESEIK